ncbi:MAG: hypothetical protein KF787_09120 [Phycisphaeraceae bacterium]|nr:hypothetical protein [Phycisphaeraceae bacterium]
MPVSGDLFQLPVQPRLIPLPWHCRAPLGLKTGTSVHIALVESGSESPFELGAANVQERTGEHPELLLRPPDLLVSVLDPREWETTYLIESCGPDGPGLLNRLLEEIATINADDKHVNVLIAESFTVPMRECKDPLLRHHKSSLYCQVLLGKPSKERLDSMVARLNQAPAGHGTREPKPVELRLAPLPAGAVALHLGQAEIRHGLVETDEDWRREAREWFHTRLRARFSEETARQIRSQFDFSLACALADLDSKAIRLMFPLKGARRLLTRHADQPNVAVQVTSRLSSEAYSILAGLLARLDATSGELAVVCEAMPGKPPLTDRSLADIRNRSAFRRIRSRQARSYADTLYPQLPKEELLRQIGKFTVRRGDNTGRFVDDLVRQLADQWEDEQRRQASANDRAKPDDDDAKGAAIKAFNAQTGAPPGKPISLVTCVPYDFAAQRCTIVRNVLNAIAKDSGYTPSNSLREDEVASGGGKAAEWRRVFNLTTANIAVFVLWKQSEVVIGRHEIESIRDAFAYEQLAYNGVGLLLVESDTDEFPPELHAITRFFSRCVTPMTFSWLPRHTDAMRRLVEDPSDVPDELFETRFLIGRVYSWLKQQRNSQESP